MTILTLHLCILTFFIGFCLGRWAKTRRTESESAAEKINRHYMQGYSAALKEFPTEPCVPRALEVVAGTDIERAS